MNELRKRKEYMLDLMLRIEGVHYTMGWLKSAWLYACDSDVDISVVEKTITELEAKDTASV
jgi:hypothetical protein